MEPYPLPVEFWFVLLGIAVSLALQAMLIIKEYGGYSKRPKTGPPEIDELKGGEKLMSVKFREIEVSNEEYEGYQELKERIDSLKRKEADES